MQCAKNDHVLVVGAGIAGLMTGYRLAQYKLNPIVVEHSELAANGSTTRNQGWLHAGAQHAQSIADPEAAASVAKRCRYGLSQYLAFCPEAVEDSATPSIAVSMNENRIAHIVGQWRESEVKFEEISLENLERLAPGLSARNVKAAWMVEDVAVDTRVICTKLVASIRHLGGKVLFGTHVSKVTDESVQIQSAAGGQTLTPAFTVIACGYSTNDILRSHWNTEIPIRYWKSHLLITPTLTTANVFSVDPGEVSFFQHGDTTVIGMLQDNIPCLEPSLDVDYRQITKMRHAIERIAQLPLDFDDVFPTACVKVDIANVPRASRGLDVETIEIAPNVLCIFPGKMTEAPFLADKVLRIVLKETNSLMSHQRPLYEWQRFSGDFPPVSVSNKIVMKTAEIP